MTTASRPLLRIMLVVSLLLAAVLVPVAPSSAEPAPPAIERAELDGVPEARDREQANGLAPEAQEDGPEARDEQPGDERPDLSDEQPGDEPTDDEGRAQPEPPVAESSESEPTVTPMRFSMLGFELPEGVDVVHVRARGEDGWSTWYAAEAQELVDAPDAGSGEEAQMSDITRLSEPLWFGDADAIQLRLPEGGSTEEVKVHLIDSMGNNEGFLARAARHLTPRHAPAQASTPMPVVSRSQWGAKAASNRPSYARTVDFSVVHHTAGGNTYTASQAPGVVRGIQSWHMDNNGWSDIGYNFLVDRFGTVYEGRAGGMDRAVIGAHARGWNTGSTGIAIMGNYNSATPTTGALNAFADVLAWKFSLHGVDPAGGATTVVNNQRIPTIVAHRNIRGNYVANPSTTTDCPGQNFYVRMDSLRERVASRASSFSSPLPVTGDWNNDGRETIGWFYEGEWLLRNANSTGSSDVRFRYGSAGDLPVIGDWNGDGRSTVGVVRGPTWLLRNSNSSGHAQISFNYGRGGIDHPMAGDWNGNGQDGPVIIRDGEWHLRNSLTDGPGQISFTYGRLTQGDLPLVGDWSGNGRDGVGIIRGGEWHLRNTLSAGPGQLRFTYGRVAGGDFPITGDWNRNGTTGVGITRGDEWYLRNSLSGGNAQTQFTFGWW